MRSVVSRSKSRQTETRTPAELRGEDLRKLLERLVGWGSDMGGWEARIWSDSSAFLSTITREEDEAKRGGRYGKPDAEATPAEKRGEELRVYVADLVDWQANIGCWVGQVWTDARQLLNDLRREEEKRKLGGPYGKPMAITSVAA